MVQAGCVIMTTSPSTRLWRPWNGDNEVDSASSIQNSEVISYKLENNLQNSAPIVTNSVDQRHSSQRMDHYSESSNHYSQRLDHYTQRFNHCTQRLDLHTQRCDRYSQRLDHFPRQGMSSDIFVPDNSSMALSCMDQDVASNRPTCYMDNMDVMLKVHDFGHFMAQPLGLYGFHQTSHRSSSNHTNVADEARFHLKCKEMAAAAAANGGKWKRERRSRPATATPPAYPLKTAQISQHPEPIDMSTRKIRGSPPSYSQTISAGYINRPPTTTTSPIANNSPITNTNSVTTEAEADSDLDSSMPVIDEHFRRSLGKHYQSVFAPSSASSASSSTSSSHSSSRPRIASNGQTTDDSSSDSADNAGSALSVDEHFAKALGETWLKLQQKEKSTSSATNGVSHSHSSSTMTITTTTNSPLVLVPSSVPDHSLLRVNRIEP